MVDSLMSGGAELLATRIALGLDPDRFESVVCSTRPSAREHVAAVEAAGLEVLQLRRASKLDVWRWLPLVRLLRSGRIDVLHAHKFGSNLWASLLTRLAPVPVLLAHEHSWSFEGAPLRRLVDRELVARASTAIVAVSEPDRTRMVELERIPPEKVLLVPNGIPDQQPGNRTAARAALGIQPEDPVVGTVCGLRPEKGVDVALRAVARVADALPGLRFLAVGDGPERPRLERLARELGVAALFTGRRPNADVPDLLAAMDVVVCSSRSEGMPLAVLEWMAAARAIIAFAVGGIPTMIADGREGVLVPPRDAARLAAAIERLLADPAERERLGAAARARQRREFPFRRTLDAIQEIYESAYGAALR